MPNNILAIPMILCLAATVACSLNEGPGENHQDDVTSSAASVPHQYGGWYCPDNLGGFPAVDILDWNDVPVVNGRMAT